MMTETPKNEKLIARLIELSGAVSNHDMSEFTMRVPVDGARDADCVLANAAMVIGELEVKLAAAKKDHIATIQPSDPEDGFWLSHADVKKLRALPSGTKLYIDAAKGNDE